MNIKEQRLQLGMTMIDLAVECGVSLTTIQLWERGVNKPTEENQAKLDNLFFENFKERML